MRPSLYGLGLAAAVCFGALGCDESLSSVTGPTPNLQPTFSSIQNDIFNSSDSSGRRTCVSCHNSNGRVPAGLLDLTGPNAHANLVGAASRIKAGAVRVIAGDPDNSYLVQKIEGAPGITGLRMPLVPPYLTDGQILVIRRWIARGAPND